MGEKIAGEDVLGEGRSGVLPRQLGRRGREVERGDIEAGGGEGLDLVARAATGDEHPSPDGGIRALRLHLEKFLQVGRHAAKLPGSLAAEIAGIPKIGMTGVGFIH